MGGETGGQRGLELLGQTGDTLDMNMNDLATNKNGFERGVSSIGQFFPATIPYSDYPTTESAWKGVASSFRQAGDSLRFAIKKRSDVKRKDKQTV